MNEQNYSLDILGSDIFIKIINTGDGINAMIYGGEKPHIGAVSVKQPGNPLVTHEFPRHRESLITSKWAESLCEHYSQTAVVSCGIHYDDLTQEQIRLIVESLDQLLDDILKG